MSENFESFRFDYCCLIRENFRTESKGYKVQNSDMQLVAMLNK